MLRRDTYQRILDEASRPDPYPLYRELRETPVARQEDGSYVVSTYWEILQLLHDPRLSSDIRKQAPAGADPLNAEETGLKQPFLVLDPPEHDRLRRLAMRHFGPPTAPCRVTDMTAELAGIVGELLDGLTDRHEADLVDAFSYPFPVTVICRLLGVPREDERQFRRWADVLVESLDPSPAEDPSVRMRRRVQASGELNEYLGELIEKHRGDAGEDMLSGLATDRGPEGRMRPEDLLATARLLLIAGHETTVNLISNGMLTLLRHPELLRRMRDEPEFAVRFVEELLRYEPPVQLVPFRTALDDIDVGGVTILEGSPVSLVLASGNRDPARFRNPEWFDPDREDNQHLGFGSGVHLCFGAPLARVEARLALTEFATRLRNPRLTADPPPYRQSPVLRGPRHLPVTFDQVVTRPRGYAEAGRR
jgi:cytochrome P450